MKRRFIVFATCILLVMLFTGSAVAANSFSSPVFTPGDPHELTITRTEGGTTSSGGTILEGDTATVTATPNTGYIFVRWEVGIGGSTASTSATYSFTMPESDYSLHAVFEQIPPTVSPTPSDTPSPSPSPTPTSTPTPTPTRKPTATPKPTVTAIPTPITETTTVPAETTAAPTETTAAPTDTTVPEETAEPTATPTPAAAAAKSTSDSGGGSKKGLGLIVLIGLVLFMVIGATIAGFIEEYKGRKKSVIKKPSDNPTNNYRY